MPSTRWFSSLAVSDVPPLARGLSTLKRRFRDVFFVISVTLSIIHAAADRGAIEVRPDSLSSEAGGNRLFTAWQPQVGVTYFQPMGSLQNLAQAWPGLHAGFSTPYAGNLSAFGVADYAYGVADRAPMDLHLLRLMAGLRYALAGHAGLMPQVGIGYHYLKGTRHAGNDTPYAFVEDGESEVAWHFGIAGEPVTGKLRHFFLLAGFDVVPTLPRASWIGLLAAGYRL